jgi:hypothetical protein
MLRGVYEIGHMPIVLFVLDDKVSYKEPSLVIASDHLSRMGLCDFESLR